jgi:ABC-type polysaccharide/polyol phosphate export permease
MPGVVHTFADVNPVTLVVNAARELTIGHGHALAPTLGTLTWLTGLLLVFVPLSVRAFDAHERHPGKRCLRSR